MDWLYQIDLTLLDLINKKMANGFFDWLLPLITDLHKNKIFLFFVVPILVAILCYKKTNKQKIIIISTLTLGIFFTDVLCGQVLKNLIERDRPASHHELNLILRVPLYGNRSFPSNHAANMFCLAMMLGHFSKSWKWPAFIIAALVALSRPYVGLHYPSDVVAGAGIGLLVGWLSTRLAQRFWTPT